MTCKILRNFPYFSQNYACIWHPLIVLKFIAKMPVSLMKPNQDILKLDLSELFSIEYTTAAATLDLNTRLNYLAVIRRQL